MSRPEHVATAAEHRDFENLGESRPTCRHVEASAARLVRSGSALGLLRGEEVPGRSGRNKCRQPRDSLDIAVPSSDAQGSDRTLRLSARTEPAGRLTGGSWGSLEAVGRRDRPRTPRRAGGLGRHAGVRAGDRRHAAGLDSRTAESEGTESEGSGVTRPERGPHGGSGCRGRTWALGLRWSTDHAAGPAGLMPAAGAADHRRWSFSPDVAPPDGPVPSPSGTRRGDAGVWARARDRGGPSFFPFPGPLRAGGSSVPVRGPTRPAERARGGPAARGGPPADPRGRPCRSSAGRRSFGQQPPSA
jgi:hypothetical protein